MSLQGVYKTAKKDGTVSYRSSITFHNKHISLGSFSNETEAHHAYKTAWLLLTESEYYLHDYTKSSCLSFEKWVSLINYRDNHIYFSTPIYLMKSYFLYYLSPELELKFSLDDLFYYSSHKIMKRNGHLFVADYGMQVNLYSRYGIKNYAIRGKDYEFINQDPYDFRLENIRVLNTYYGVDQVKRNNKLYVRSRIHSRSYYLIGFYESALEAAIAYNKAIDVLKKNGINKNYTMNYIDEVSPQIYADIYHQIIIPETILQIKEAPNKT